MKKTLYLLFITLLCAAFQTQAQTVSFSYDDDGNMTERKVVGSSGVKSSPKDTASVSVSDEIGNQKITIYPNPTKGKFQVAINKLDQKQNNYYLLYTLAGARIQEKKITDENTYIDISGYPAGAYLLDVYLGNKVSRWKMIKQ